MPSPSKAQLLAEVARLRDALRERDDQLAATASIPRTISRSSGDLQAVFDAVVQSATTLCDAAWGAAFRFDGRLQTLAAHHGVTAVEREVLHREFPRPVTRERATGRAIADRRVVHVADLQTDPEYAGAPLRAVGFRTVLAVPMLRDGEPIGVVGLWRREVRPFTEKQIELISTFADQAVVAIENVRLFNDLEARTGDLAESLEQQTATSEILRVISSSPADIQPILDAVAQSAARLCQAFDAAIFRRNGDELRVVAHHGPIPIRPILPVVRGTSNGRAVLDGRTVHVVDMPAEVDEFPEGSANARAMGHRTVLAVPLMRDGAAIGTINVRRTEARRFTERQVTLLRTFADQAVIAIENIRLFEELQAKNAALTQAHAQVTGLFREIAQKSRELEVASAHKSEFLASMSHELRTPLNAIIGYSEMLQEDAADLGQPIFVDDLAKINASARHLLSLINDILDLSKIEAGRMDLDLADFDLPQTIDDALMLMRERASRRAVTLGCVVDERLGRIRADERKVKQVLLNLLSNAVKFTPEGGRIDVRAGLVDDGVEISITDTGVGIAPEDQAAVFEQFRQVGSAAKNV